MANLRDLNAGSSPYGGPPTPLAGFLHDLHQQYQGHAAAHDQQAREGPSASPSEHEDPPASVPDTSAPPPPPPGHGPPPPGRGPPPFSFGGPFGGGPFGGPPGGHDGGPRGGPSHGWGPPWAGRGGGRGWGGGRGGRSGGPPGGPPGGSPFGAGGFDLSNIGEFLSHLTSAMAPDGSTSKDMTNPRANNKDFQPLIDIFDTEKAFIVHASLPGAKKADIGVNWDADKYELSIAGVICRPGDEETLKTLALDERQTGPFERKVVLGTKENPAQVDADGISAKMEDGVLLVTIPKLQQDFVEVKKVTIE